MPVDFSRRDLLKGAALTAGAAALVQGSLAPSPVLAQSGEMPAGTAVQFAKGGVTFHTYISPAQAVHVTSHVVEFEDQLLLVDGTMLPPTAAEVQALIASTGKPVAKAVLSHIHPDHWGAAGTYDGLTFSTLAAITEGVAGEAGGPFTPPSNLSPDLELGATEIAGVPVEFRNYPNAEAPDMVVTVLPSSVSPSSRIWSTTGCSSRRGSTGRTGSRRWRRCARMRPSTRFWSVTACPRRGVSWIPPSPT